MVREALTPQALRGLAPDEAAAEFVTRGQDGLTEGEQALLAVWLGSDARHGQALAGAERAWNSLAGAGDDEVLAAMRAHALAPPRAARPAWGYGAAAAAVLVIAVGAALSMAPQLNRFVAPARAPVVATAAVAYAAPVGAVKAFTLPDGSQMTLDADSAAVGRFGGGGRQIELTRGRALFAVTHDAARPFTVIAGDRAIVDLGTRFDVNLGPRSLTVTLLEGRLAIEPRAQVGATTKLSPGQQFTRADGHDRIEDLGTDAARIADWRDGMVRFNHQPLSEASAIMNRYSTEKIVIPDPEVAAIRVTGQFRAGESRAFADTLRELYGLRAHRDGDRIELRRGG